MMGQTMLLHTTTAEEKDDDDTGWLGSQWDLISEDVYICRTTLFVAVVVLSSRVSASLFAKQPQTSKMASLLLIFSVPWI